METYYTILGIPENASDREIKQAYRALARKLHPDVCQEPGAEDQFKRINEAYRVLSDHEERSRYDALGPDGYRRRLTGIRGFPGRHHHGGRAFRGFNDAFDLFFSERAWGPGTEFRPRSPADILVRIQVPFEEAIAGTERVVEVPYALRCPSCGGTGSSTGKVHPCPLCGGAGADLAGPVTGPGDPGQGRCRECDGKGRIPESPCTRCGGWGATQAARQVTVHVPAGIDHGMRIRKEGLGLAGDGEVPTGDLFIEVTVLPHDRLTRKGDDLEVVVPVSPARAALGSEVDVPTVGGKAIRVDIPPGVRDNAVVRVKGEGVRVRDRSGDLLVRVRIDTPEKTTAEERELYRRLLKIEEEREGTRRKGILSRYFTKKEGRER
ncbi:MAG TPA: J domain-containing protein [Methanomicrobiales archaeon]|nr:J domain-containing protein [Methanomicrobiales archaeon]